MIISLRMKGLKPNIKIIFGNMGLVHISIKFQLRNRSSIKINEKIKPAVTNFLKLYIKQNIF